MNIENMIDPLESEFEEELKGERFKVVDLETADWVFRKIKQAREELQAKKIYVEEQKAKYDAFYAKEEESANGSSAFFEGLLLEYYIEQKTLDPKYRLKTALGTASTRTTKSWDYGNEVELIKYLKEQKHLDFIKTETKESIDKNELKKALTVEDGVVMFATTGEILDEITVSDKTSFTVKLT